MSILEMFPVSILDDKLASLNLNDKPVDYSNEFPFLVNENTIHFIKKSKVMFINRGLPGSGKSSLAKKIADLYETTIICSADDYFLDEEGNYNFDIEKRPTAHEECKQKAKNCCSNSISPLIIDNTNLIPWEIKYYLDLAKQHNYIVLLIEPRTPHKFDIEKLAILNKHRVSLEVLKKKIDQYQIIVPYYLGWFLNESDSNDLLNQAKSAYTQAFSQLAQLKKDINLKHEKEEYLNYQSGCLHCTSKYIGRGIKHHYHLKHSDEVPDYVKNELVSLSIGKVFELKIIGFSLTDKTFAAIVELNDTESQLWQNSLNKQELDQFFIEHQTVKISNLDKLKHGNTAHITLAKADQIKANYSGIDLLKINLHRIDSPDGKVKSDSNDNQFIYFGDCLCLIKLKSPILIDALFTGYY